jgi:phage tail sheath protein FI
MTTPIFGEVFTRVDDDPLPSLGADFSTIGLVETSEDADATVFPLNVPVRFTSTDAAYLSKLGTGYLADAVNAINDQLGPFQSSADVTVVRVAEGAAADAPARLAQTSANIIGTAAAQTGLFALAAAPAELGVTPRLVWAGRTAWRPDNVTGNPVVAALPEILNRLLAIAVVDAPDASRDAAIAWRGYVPNSERIMPVGVAAKVFAANATVVTRPMAPRIIGVIAGVDGQFGGKPFNPFANRPVQNIVGTSRPIAFSLTDGAVEGQQLLAADIGVVVRGEPGVDAAISDGGFVFVGTDSVTNSDLWSQIHQIRGTDYLMVKMLRLTRQFLGRAITADMVEAWINSIKFMLRDHKAANEILGYQVKFTPDRNSPEEIRLGHLVVSPYIEPVPVFKRATHEIRRYRPAVDALVQEIVARVNATI